ncbi:MAG: glycosyltransferase family 2 protein [Spirochaetia bacterium]|nr:MAG: glycosyltransferase family 2 protein [Spirochaetia bacterium]
MSLSVIILTYNEELNLEKCLKSVAGLTTEVFIVDSYSKDKTLEIAKKYGAKIVKHPFENQAKQFNWALDNLKIKTEWILRLDADEYLADELKHEITETLKNAPDGVSGYYIKRRVCFMGRWMKHGGYYPAWFLRLFRYGKARYEEREVDEHAVLLDGQASRLKNDFVDENRQKLEWWIGKQNNHSSREVSAILREKEIRNKIRVSPSFFGNQAERKRWLKEKVFMKSPMFFRALLYFIYRYFFRLGFLDGKEGLIFHFLSAMWYRFIIDAKLYEAYKIRRNN